jgi:eukaryotic-like serine/threonine-protein kinase
MPDRPTRRLHSIKSRSEDDNAQLESSSPDVRTQFYRQEEPPTAIHLSPNTDGTDGIPIQIFGHLSGVEISKSLRQWAQPLTSDLGQVDSDCHARYVVGEVIGQGGMGAVHRGWDLQLQRCVAIKIISEEQLEDPNGVHRFLREARIASRLQHPGIVKIHDVDIDASGNAFIVMDLLSGNTLDFLVKKLKKDRVQLASMLLIFQQVCQAVAYAHAHAVVHRDLKPSNIMVGDYGVVVVLDWGLAKLSGDLEPSSIPVSAQGASKDDIRFPVCLKEASIGFGDIEPFETDGGLVLGTPNYLAPEQARGEEVDARADVFSLGAILCEMLTGKPPFCGKNAREIQEMSAQADLSNAFDRLDAATAPQPIIRLTRQCLAPSPDHRPGNAGVVAEALTEYLESGQRRAEIELVRFFELSLDLFCIANTRGYFCRVNDNFPKVLGYSAEYLTSRQFIEFVHPKDQSKTIAEVERLARLSLIDDKQFTAISYSFHKGDRSMVRTKSEARNAARPMRSFRCRMSLGRKTWPS